jgi:secreted Zn-dependent insulinase-like peptidase
MMTQIVHWLLTFRYTYIIVQILKCIIFINFKADITSPKTSALLLFLRRKLAEPAFTELRTKKQLGYIVSLSTSGFGR